MRTLPGAEGGVVESHGHQLGPLSTRQRRLEERWSVRGQLILLGVTLHWDYGVRSVIPAATAGAGPAVLAEAGGAQHAATSNKYGKL